MANLDGDDKVAFDLQEMVSVECNYSGLVRLCNVSKNNIHHSCRAW